VIVSIIKGLTVPGIIERIRPIGAFIVHRSLFRR
jgi:hypothetical protein